MVVCISQSKALTIVTKELNWTVSGSLDMTFLSGLAIGGR